MQILFLEMARAEFDDAIAYYNSECPGLGETFLLDALNAIERIRRFPLAWHPFTEDTRRCQLRRFPYGIIYQIEDKDILVLAVANLHREPDYWQDRLQQ